MHLNRPCQQLWALLCSLWTYLLQLTLHHQIHTISNYQCSCFCTSLSPWRFYQVQLAAPTQEDHSSFHFHYIQAHEPLQSSSRIPWLHRCLQQEQGFITCSPLQTWSKDQLGRRNLSPIGLYLLPFYLWAWIPPDISRWTPSQWFYLPLFLCSHCFGSLHLQKGWYPPPLCRLQRTQQNHKKRLLITSTYLQPPRCSRPCQDLHQNQPPTCIPFGPHCQRWWMEDFLPHTLWLLWMASYAIWSNQHSCYVPGVSQHCLH